MQRGNMAEEKVSTVSTQQDGNILPLASFVCSELHWNKRLHINEMSPFHSHFLPCLVFACSRKHTYVHAYILKHTPTRTLCLWLPAYSSSLSKIKVLPCLCEYNITLLSLFIFLPVSNCLIKSCEKGVLKGFSCYCQYWGGGGRGTSSHLPCEEPCL